MAECDVATLISDACASGFTCLVGTERMARAVELQLLKEIAGNTQTLEELIASACASGFLCLEEQMSNAVELQLLCDISGGT